MHNILLIIDREYRTRIRKRSFWVTTALGPLSLLVMLIVPIWLSTADKPDSQTVLVSDQTAVLAESFEDSKAIRFITAEDKNGGIQENHLLFIPEDFPQQPALLTSSKANEAVRKWIDLNLRSALFENAYPAYAEQEVLTVGDHAKAASSETWLAEIIGYGSAIFIYFFIFLYGMQVMKGVVEEKTSRIVEVMLSSVRPFDLMLGKIAGIGLLGVTQMLIWIVGGALVGWWFFDHYQLFRYTDTHIAQTVQLADADFALQMNGFMSQLAGIHFPTVIGSFVFFFVFGYLIYGALFAIIGAASNPETETQQFIFPLSLPLLVGILCATPVMQAPDDPLAHALSYIPFTAPIIMSVRIPFAGEIQHFELQWFLSALGVVLGFLATTWIAAKIYRFGILLYGQKIGYGQMMGWLKRK